MSEIRGTSQQPAVPVFYITPPVPPQLPLLNASNAEGSMGETPAVAVGRDPVIMTCPHCRCRNKTRTNLRATAKTHLACCLLSWTLCFCRLPYRMKSCLNTDHFCPTCDAFLGTFAA